MATGHVTAALELPEGLDTGPAATAADRLPGGWHLSASAGGDDPVVTVACNAGDPAVTVQGRTVRMRLTHAAAGSSTLAYATYAALERARQQRQMLTLQQAPKTHAASFPHLRQIYVQAVLALTARWPHQPVPGASAPPYRPAHRALDPGRHAAMLATLEELAPPDPRYDACPWPVAVADAWHAVRNDAAPHEAAHGLWPHYSTASTPGSPPRHRRTRKPRGSPPPTPGCSAP